MVKVEVKVKKSDIEAEIDSYGCGALSPLDLAVERTFPKANFISVTNESILLSIYYTDDGPRYDKDIFLKLPKSAQKFASNLGDSSVIQEPFSFVVNLKDADAALLKPAKKFVVAA